MVFHKMVAQFLLSIPQFILSSVSFSPAYFIEKDPDIVLRCDIIKKNPEIALQCQVLA